MRSRIGVFQAHLYRVDSSPKNSIILLSEFPNNSFLMVWIFIAFYICCLPELLYDETIYIASGRLFVLEHRQIMTKLRPIVCTFLKEASKLFDMYIYTMGDRRYSLIRDGQAA